MNKSILKKMREIPMFPFIPIVPLDVMVTVISFSIMTYQAGERLEKNFKRVYPPGSL